MTPDRSTVLYTSLKTFRKQPQAFLTTDRMADASFMQEFLETHNAYRKKHNAPLMKYNSNMNETAQKWANHLLAEGVFEHSQTNDGENIYNMFSSATIKLTGKEAVDSWYGEIKDYNWSSPGFSGNTGHFTQVVWKASTELGVGVATDGNKVFVVGQYRPAGNMNMSGYFEENVLRGAGGEPGGADKPNSEGGGASPKKTCTLL